VLTDGRNAQPVDGLTAATDDGVRPTNALVAQFLAERRRDGAARVEDYLREETRSAASVSLAADRQALYGVVRALMRAVEARDRYARGHADRVARLAVAIAKEMGCPEDMTDGVRVAARLHDIGRVSVSDMILLKPGPLTELETEIIRTHPLVGVQILDALEFPWSVKPAVRYHHERLDGSGYPEGLMGDEIPLGARIVAVADVVAAMTADRPYRQALAEEEALAELAANAGEKYDSQVVDALGRVLERGLT
jgi:putative nucleotidyltransferase with HDIG domain